MEVCFHAFLTSALDEGEWSASRPGRFNTGRDTNMHWTEVWVGHRVLVRTKKIPSLPLSGIESRSSSPYSRQCNGLANPAPTVIVKLCKLRLKLSAASSL